MKNIVSPARLLVLLFLSFAVHGAVLWAISEKSSLGDGIGSEAIQADFGADAEATEVAMVETPAAPVVEKKIEAKKVIATTLPKKEVITQTKTPATQEKLPQTTVANETTGETADEPEILDPEITDEPNVELIPVKESIAGVSPMDSEDITQEEESVANESATEEAISNETPVSDIAPVTAVNTAAQSAATSVPPSTAQTQGNGEGKIRSYQSLRQAAGNQPPQYPTQARRLGQQGNVNLKYFVTEAGSVKDVAVEKSSGSELLDNEAVRAVSAYRFFPGQSGWTTHPVRFSLKGPQEALPSRLRTSGSSLGN